MAERDRVWLEVAFEGGQALRVTVPAAVADDLDRALDAAKGNEAIVRGIEIVKKQLHDVLEQEGLERVTADGAFDPAEHEAVSSVPGDVDEPTVLEVVRPGYKLKGKTVRPALVHVTVPEGGTE